jgi:hypothetical protein
MPEKADHEISFFHMRSFKTAVDKPPFEGAFGVKGLREKPGLRVGKEARCILLKTTCH